MPDDLFPGGQTVSNIKFPDIDASMPIGMQLRRRLEAGLNSPDPRERAFAQEELMREMQTRDNRNSSSPVFNKSLPPSPEVGQRMMNMQQQFNVPLANYGKLRDTATNEDMSRKVSDFLKSRQELNPQPDWKKDPKALQESAQSMKENDLYSSALAKMKAGIPLSMAEKAAYQKYSMRK